MAWDDVALLAIQLAKRRGYAVFPCNADKRPTLKDWPNMASNQPLAVARLWVAHGGPLIGVATGVKSGIDVLDFDIKHNEVLHWWHVYCGQLPATEAYRTRSGGRHHYFQHAEGVRNTASKICKGIDTRGEGGYVVHWFSSGLPCLSHEAPAPWPAWLLDQVLRQPPPVQTPSRARYDGPPNPDLAIHGMLRRVVSAAQGERNTILNWAAWRMGARVREGELSQAEAESLLTEAASAAGLDAVEAARTIASGLGGGRR